MSMSSVTETNTFSLGKQALLALAASFAIAFTSHAGNMIDEPTGEVGM